MVLPVVLPLDLERDGDSCWSSSSTPSCHPLGLSSWVSLGLSLALLPLLSLRCVVCVEDKALVKTSSEAHGDSVNAGLFDVSTALLRFLTGLD